MDSPQQCVPTHCFLRLEPSIVQATSFHQQLPLWMCLPLTHPSSLFSVRRDFSPPPDFRTVRNCPEPLSMRRRTAFLRQGCRILYIVGVCVNRIGAQPISFDRVEISFDIQQNEMESVLTSSRVAELLLAGFGEADLIIYGDQLERRKINP